VQCDLDGAARAPAGQPVIQVTRRVAGREETIFTSID
jgi:hypothetical protein